MVKLWGFLFWREENEFRDWDKGSRYCCAGGSAEENSDSMLLEKERGGAEACDPNEGAWLVVLLVVDSVGDQGKAR